jgi:CubicO group peptidase (beta-lactamase class C family)
MVTGQGAYAQSELEGFVDSVVSSQIEKRKIAGAVVTMVRDGAVVISKGYGVAEVATRRPMTSATLVRIGSITKTFTALAVMQLVEAGKLDLDRDINQYLDFTIPTPPGRVPVTLRRLLSHQAGFEDRPGDIGALGAQRLPLGPYLARHMPPRLSQRDDIVAYSNYNAALAAYVVERTSGQQFEQYVDEHIFRPLQMTRTTAVQPVPEGFLPHVSSGYVLSDQPPSPVSMAAATIYEVGSTGIVTSGDDMGRLMIALLNSNSRPVSPAAVQTMMTTQARVPRGVVGLGFFSPLGSGGNTFIGHDGGTGGFQSTMALLPQARFGVFASYNSEGMPARVAAAGELLARVSDRYFAGVPRPGRNSPNGDVSGVYQFTRRVESNLYRLRSLFDQAAVRADARSLTLRPAMLPFGEPLNEIEPGLFRWSGVDVSFEGSGPTATMQLGSAVGQFVRVPWWTSAGLVVPTVVGCVVIGTTTLLMWPIRRFRRSRAHLDEPTRRLAALVRLSLLLDILAIGAALWLVLWGRPLVALSSPIVAPLALAIYAAAWAGVMLTPLAAWHAVRLVRRGVGDLWTRGKETGLVLIHAILVTFCLYWRIAGTTLAF